METRMDLSEQASIHVMVEIDNNNQTNQDKNGFNLYMQIDA